MVRRILIWIVKSARPLTIAEVRDGIISNTMGESVNSDDRLINSDDILRMCSGIVVEATEVNDDTGKPQTTLRLTHDSFMGFFRRNHTVGPLTHFQHSDGDRILANCCLTYLLTFNEGIPLPDGDLSDFPLLAYAAEYWPYHARRIEDAQSWHSNTTQLIMRLFNDGNGSSFSNWLKLFDPAASSRSVDSTQRIDALSSPLFYASLLGLRHVLALLIESSGKDSAPELEAGLFEASSKGYADIVHLLLEQGVNPNTEHSSGGRPLDVAILNSHKMIVELLLHYDANVTYENGIIGSPFRTAIHTASTSDDVALASLLLRTTKVAMPPEAFLETLSEGLRDAARIGNLEVVQLLFNAFYIIAGHLDTKETFENRSVKVRRATLRKRLELLCDDGVGPVFDTQQGSPNMRLHIAVLLNREAAFGQALEMPEAVNSGWADSGWTPLHLAAQENNVEMYTRLIEAKADPLAPDKSGHIAKFYFPQPERGVF